MRTLTLSLLLAPALAHAEDLPVDLEVYGTIVVNAAYDTGTPFPSQEAATGAAMGSLVDGALPTDGNFLITPRQSRIGVKATRQLSEAWKAKAVFELDNFGLHENRLPTGVNQSGLRLRHGYARFSTERVELTAGQTQVVVTPRAPTSLGHMAIALHSLSGNIWNRLPQLTATGKLPVGEGGELHGTLSLTRPFTGHGLGGAATRFDVPDPATQGRLPQVHAHLGFDSDAFKIGAAGVIGRETYDLVAGKDLVPGPTYGETLYEEQHVAVWLASLDWKAKLGPAWCQGQVWTGQNLFGFLGRQGVRADEWEDVPASDPRAGQIGSVTGMRGTGGWAELGATVVPDRLDLVASYGIDRGDPGAVDYGAVWLNTGAFGAVVLHPAEDLSISFEALRSTTKYRPDDEYRTDEDYDPRTDPFRGEPLPRRMREGFNDNLTFNVVYSF
jgi:hypothetical protein